MLTTEKLECLYNIIRRYKNAVISLSGGTDSVAIAAAAKEALGAESVKTVTAITAFLTESEIRQAKEAASEIGLEHTFVRVHCMRSPDVIKNDENICYYCKKIILEGIESVKNNLGCDVIFDGTNSSGNNESTLKNNALKEFGVVSPFALAGFDKHDVKELLEFYGLGKFIMPSNSCLAMRIKKGQHLDFYHIRLICAAETYLQSLGYSNIRCRVDGNDAHIQVDNREVKDLIAQKAELDYEFKMMGFNALYIDEDGYLPT